jgi:hypothetical protein
MQQQQSTNKFVGRTIQQAATCNKTNIEKIQTAACIQQTKQKQTQKQTIS